MHAAVLKFQVALTSATRVISASYTYIAVPGQPLSSDFSKCAALALQFQLGH